MSTAAIRCELDRDAHIGRIIIARADAGNAFTMEMVASMRDGFSALALSREYYRQSGLDPSALDLLIR